MATDNLYLKMSQVMRDGKMQGKSVMGYTVSQYQGVLAALHAAANARKTAQQLSRGVIAGSVPTEGDAISRLSTLTMEGGEADNVLGLTLPSLGLMYANVKPYMSFPIHQIADDGTIIRRYVKTPQPVGKDYVHIHNGISLMNSSPSFPPTVIDDQVIGHLSTGCGDMNSPCIIGTGVDFEHVQYYFNECYKLKVQQSSQETSLKWEKTMLKDLATKGFLYSQVLFYDGIEGETARYNSFHIKVTAEIPSDKKMIQLTSFPLWIPVPILLLKSFEKIAGFAIQTPTKILVRNPVQGSDNGKFQFPLNESGYILKDAAVKYLTPDYLKGFVPRLPNTGSSYMFQCKISNFESACKVRFYFDEAARAEEKLAPYIAALQEDKANELFHGYASQSSATIIQTSNVGYVAQVGINYNAVLQKIGREINLTSEQVHRAVIAISNWEGGTDNTGTPKWARWVLPNDNTGYNIGPVCITEKSGGVYKVVTALIQSFPQFKDALTSIAQRAPKTNISQKYYATRLSSTDGDIIREVYNSNPDLFSAVYLQCVEDGYWGQQGITAYKNSKFTSPLGFAISLAHAIWRPSLVVNDYANAGISSSTSSETTKIELAGAAFIRRGLKEKGYGTLPSYSTIITSVKANDAQAQSWKSFLTSKNVGGWYVRGSKIIINSSDTSINNIQRFKYS